MTPQQAYNEEVVFVIMCLFFGVVLGILFIGAIAYAISESITWLNECVENYRTHADLQEINRLMNGE